MNNIVYVGNFLKNKAVSPSILYSFINQKIPSFLIGVFDNSITRDIYYNYFIEYTESLKLYNSSILKDIVNEYIHKYEWFVLLSNDCLYYKDYSKELLNFIEKNNDTQEHLIYPHNSKNQTSNTVVLHRKKILTYIQDNLTLEEVFSLYSHTTDQKNINKIQSFHSIDMNYSITNNNALYEDSYCIFGKFINTDNLGILDSVVYINKNNNRVYNIVNNLIGYMTSKNGDIISIDWYFDGTENSIRPIKYVIDHFKKCYSAF